MTEDEIRAMVEQIDPDGEISDAKKEELVLRMMEQYGTPAEEETAKVQVEEPEVVSDDWRGRAAQAARHISRDMFS